MKTTFALALTFAAAALAAPTTKRSGSAQVKLCTGANESGHCQDFDLPFNEGEQNSFTECVQLKQPTYTSPLYNSIGTFAVSPGTYCRTTSVDNCANLGSGDTILFPPGSQDFHNYTGGHAGDNDLGSRTASFKCQICTNCN